MSSLRRTVIDFKLMELIEQNDLISILELDERIKLTYISFEYETYQKQIFS